MKAVISYLLLILTGLFPVLLGSCLKEHIVADNNTIITLPTDAKPVVKTNSQKVYVHYMPTYEDPTTSGDGHWGGHWTMATQNPDIILPDGRRQIASWFYPLIGPYASSDPDVLDYHLLLMKYAGIDGAIVDWSGVHNVYDYPLIRRNTDSLFNRIPKAGLQLAICYEDASLPHVQDVAGIDYITAAQEDFEYLRSNYFTYSHYATIGDKPLLLCFGPQVLKTGAEWQMAFSKLTIKPFFISLEYHGDATGASGNGEFAWVEADGLNELKNFYQNRGPLFPSVFTGAYPGFKDFYSPVAGVTPFS